MPNVGSLIESNSLYGHITAVENLQLQQKIYQCTKEEIKEVLRIVGLAGTGNKKTSQFSFGMKQRYDVSYFIEGMRITERYIRLIKNHDPPDFY